MGYSLDPGDTRLIAVVEIKTKREVLGRGDFRIDDLVLRSGIGMPVVVSRYHYEVESAALC
jgi:hypothetical protein